MNLTGSARIRQQAATRSRAAPLVERGRPRGPSRSNAVSDGSGSGAAATAAGARIAARPPAAAFAAFLGLTGAAAYGALSAQPELPPLSSVAEAAAAAAAGAAGAAAAGAAALKAALGDRFHVELHRGRLYVQVNVPSQGLPLQPGAVEVRPAADLRLGNGAFATAPIPSGTHLGDYSGDLLDRAAFFERYPTGEGDYSTAIDQEFVIDAASLVADTASFHPVHMNHSRGRANVARYYRRAEGRIAYFTTRDVAPGEELLYDYGRAYWRNREHLELP